MATVSTSRSARSTRLQDLIARHMGSNASFGKKLAELRTPGNLPPAFWEHPLVEAAAGEPVAPLALYIDAVPYSQTDSVIGWWLECLVTGARFLWAVCRKRTAYKFGCRRWCSVYSFFSLFHWPATALAKKCWPFRRRDGEAWHQIGQARAAKAGLEMLMWACILYIKGDWSEYCTTLGFPAWNDGR